MLSQSSQILYTTRNILRSFVNTCTKLSVVGMAMVLVFTFHFSYFFLPHTIFLIRILRRMRNEIHVGDRDFVETKNVQVICKINYAWTEGEEWCCQNIQDTRNSKIQQSFVCDESYFTFATVFRSLSFFSGNALGSDEQSKNPMFLDFAKQALC